MHVAHAGYRRRNGGGAGGGHAAWKDLAVDATRPWRTQTSQNIPCGVKTTHSGTFALILPSLTTS